MVTGGPSNSMARWTVAAADALGREGIPLFGIGVGSSVNPELDKLVTAPVYQHKFNIRSSDDLENIREDIVSSVFEGKSQTT